MAKPLPLVEVGFSWAKAERTEWAVAKLVELGVNVLTPLVADRTVVRPDREQAARRSERLRRIIREAAMQSRRPFLPEMGASCSVDEMARRDTPVALAEPGGSRRYRSRLRSCASGPRVAGLFGSLPSWRQR